MDSPAYDNDYFNYLEKLPNGWDPKKRETELKFIVSKHVGVSIADKIFKAVDHGLLHVHMVARTSKYSIDVSLNLILNLDIAPTLGALSLLLFEIKTQIITDFLKRKMYREEGSYREQRSKREKKPPK